MLRWGGPGIFLIHVHRSIHNHPAFHRQRCHVTTSTCQLRQNCSYNLRGARAWYWLLCRWNCIAASTVVGCQLRFILSQQLPLARRCNRACNHATANPVARRVRRPAHCVALHHGGACVRRRATQRGPYCWVACSFSFLPRRMGRLPSANAAGCHSRGDRFVGCPPCAQCRALRGLRPWAGFGASNRRALVPFCGLPPPAKRITEFARLGHFWMLPRCLWMRWRTWRVYGPCYLGPVSGCALKRCFDSPRWLHPRALGRGMISFIY